MKKGRQNRQKTSTHQNYGQLNAMTKDSYEFYKKIHELSNFVKKKFLDTPPLKRNNQKKKYPRLFLMFFSFESHRAASLGSSFFENNQKKVGSKHERNYANEDWEQTAPTRCQSNVH